MIEKIALKMLKYWAENGKKDRSVFCITSNKDNLQGVIVGEDLKIKKALAGVMITKKDIREKVLSVIGILATIAENRDKGTKEKTERE